MSPIASSTASALSSSCATVTMTSHRRSPRIPIDSPLKSLTPKPASVTAT